MKNFASSLFRSFLQAGFECSSLRRPDGTRLDLLAATRHDDLAVKDYRRLQGLNISTVRTALRWHLIESSPRRYDFNSLAPTLQAAEITGCELLLDILHFGWPESIDIFDPDTSNRFADFVYACCRKLAPYRHVIGGLCVVNEISFLSWAAGDAQAIYPACSGRGAELKRQLTRMAVVGSEIALRELPDITLITPEPAINILGRPDVPGDEESAKEYTLAQYEAWDMLSGRLAPELGGRPEYLGVLGINFYARNQWVNHRETLSPTDSRFKPFRIMLSEIYSRYRRDLFISETGAEGDDRADWFRYVWAEVAAARSAGVPVHGICLYPILNHPGWNDDRYCCCGLFDYADNDGERATHYPLASAIQDLYAKA